MGCIAFGGEGEHLHSMPWDAAEIEGNAEAFRRKFDRGGGVVAMARRALGPSGVALALHRGLIARDAVLLWESARPKILVRPGIELQPRRISWAVAHELGELILRRAHYREADVERVANALAAALLMPREAFCRAYAAEGFNLEALAEEFCAPQSAVALRVGEAAEEVVALVTPTRVHRRDPHQQLPDDEALYRMVRRAADRPAPVVCHELTDARRVVVVRAVA